MNILTLGHNHSTAPIDVREKVTFNREMLLEALSSLRKLNIIQEVVIISTCNRNEIYCVTSDAQSAKSTLIEFLYSFHRLKPNVLDGTLYAYHDEEAIAHLFAVASGVDSMIIGETQVLSQVKEAFRMAVQSRTTGLILNKLFHRCFETGKTVRHLTKISQGAVSVSFAASELARKIFEDLESKTVILIGAGETSELTAKNLSKLGTINFIVANRTFSRAEDLARTLNGRPIAIDRIKDVIEQGDIVISSTSSSGYILTYEDVGELMQKRKNSPLFIIDLAVPRDVDPKAESLYNVFLYDIDDLSSIAEENKKKREKEIAQANEIISQAVMNFMNWYKALDVTPTIVSLREHFEQIRKSELAKHMSRLSKEDIEVLDSTTRAIINKLLHSPSVEMKKAARNGTSYFLTQAARTLFGLEEKND